MKRISLLLTILINSLYLNAQTNVLLPLPNPCSVTSVEQPTEKAPDGFNVFVSPNPNAGIFTLEVNATAQLGKTICLISDIKGKTLMQEELYVSHNKLVKTLNISYLKDGVYVLSVTSGKSKKSAKLVLHKNK